MEKYLTHTTDIMAGGLQAVGSQITNAITYSAEQARIGLLHLWMVLVRQQQVVGLQMLLTGILLMVASILIVRFGKRFFEVVQNKDTWDSWDRNTLLGVLCVGVIWLSVWLFLTGITGVISSLPHIINPEYYALKESVQILNQIKQ